MSRGLYLGLMSLPLQRWDADADSDMERGGLTRYDSTSSSGSGASESETESAAWLTSTFTGGGNIC